jgi:DNA end-binding protein Ku
MMAYTMRYQEELRKPMEYFSDIKNVKVDEDSLELAETLIKKRTAKFDPSKFTDGYEAALKELVEAKIKHLPIPKDEPVAAPRGKVISLMDALRKSVQNTETAPAVAKKKPSGRETAATLFPEQEEKAGPTLVKSAAKSSRASGTAKAKSSAKRKSA